MSLIRLQPAQALACILEHTPLLGGVEVPLPSAEGRVLRQEIHAGRDFPAFDRVCMDGIAIQWQKAAHTWLHQACQVAGDRPLLLENFEHAIEVATGAVKPRGADTIVRYEDVQRRGREWILKPDIEIKRGQHIQPRGSEHRSGQSLLEPLQLLRAPEHGLLAALGRGRVLVSAEPRISLISNGSELVGIDAEIEPHQMRECNSFAARACLSAFHFQRVRALHARDCADDLREAIQSALGCSDLLILSGGISRGPKDLVAGVLTALGVEEIFSEIAQKPGRPFWFGKHPDGPLVLGLPGNPVAALLNLRLYALPALCKMEGRVLRPLRLRLQHAEKAFPDAARHLACRIAYDEEEQRWADVSLPLGVGGGSGNIGALAGTDGFISLPARERDYAAGELVLFHGWTPPSQG